MVWKGGFLSLRRTLVWCLLVLLSAGCKAQSPPNTASNSASPAPTSQLNRRIEVLVRSQFEVPPNVDVTIGATSKSDFPGFQNLPITFSSNGKQTTVNFLLSSDGNTVARLEKFDISHNPADMISTQNRPLRGTPDAKVTIVNFDDLECPYCARMHEQLFPATGIATKGWSSSSTRTTLWWKSTLGRCTRRLTRTALRTRVATPTGALWIMCIRTRRRSPERRMICMRPCKTLDKLAHDEGERSKLDLAKLDACIAKQDETAVRASMKQGDSLGVSGTPTLFINGERISGALPEAEIWMAIDRALREAGVQPPPQVAEAAKKPLRTSKLITCKREEKDR